MKVKDKEKGIYIKPCELQYIRHCVSADIEYRKNNNYYKDVDDALNRIGNRIIKRIEKELSNNFEIWFRKEVLDKNNRIKNKFLNSGLNLADLGYSVK